MPTFETPEPISVSLELGVGDVRIAASDRSDTVVEVRPSDPTNEGDVTAAEQARVEYAAGRLVVKAPEELAAILALGRVRVDRRRNSLAGRLASGRRGRRGRAALHRPRRRAPLQDGSRARSTSTRPGPSGCGPGAGDVSVERATGRAEITTGSGAVEVGGVDGPAVVKNSNGDTWIGDVAGDLRANAANGKIAVDRPRSTVVAKSGQRRHPPRRSRAGRSRGRDRVRPGRHRRRRRRRRPGWS